MQSRKLKKIEYGYVTVCSSTRLVLRGEANLESPSLSPHIHKAYCHIWIKTPDLASEMAEYFG